MRSGSVITRVLAAVVILSAVFAVVLVYNASSQRRLVAELARVNAGWVPVVRQIDAAQNDLRAMARVISNGDPVVLRPALRASLTLAPLPERIAQRVQTLGLSLQALSEPGVSEQESRLLATLQHAVTQLTAETQAQSDAAAALLLALDGEDGTMEPLRESLVVQVAATEERIGALGELVEARVAEMVSRVRVEEQRSLNRMIGASVVALLMAILVAVSIRRVLHPIVALTAEAERLKRGDYRAPDIAAGNDEIGVLAREFTHMAQAIADRDARLRRSRDELETAYEKLVHAQRAQVQAERLAAIGEISSRITHELRNPLSSIGLNIEMLSDELKSANLGGTEIDEMLSVIDTELARLTQLTDRYLGMARGDGRARSAVQLESVVHDVVSQMRPLLHRDGVTLETSLTPAEVLADPNQLRQVLINLVQNAAQAVRLRGDAGHVHVTVTTTDGEVTVLVEDDGPGVPSELRDSIFEPFTSTREEGTGLGLSICRRIVVDHGGKLQLARSTQFGGAQFAIRLAQSDVAAPKDEPLETPI
ncbi:MAG: two-component system NtrC family sensor kinase [Bradymonadia bacterium]|jgi:two-component system NtrC family sensor kinase